jgi:hypothetical protein
MNSENTTLGHVAFQEGEVLKPDSQLVASAYFTTGRFSQRYNRFLTAFNSRYVLKSR